MEMNAAPTRGQIEVQIDDVMRRSGRGLSEDAPAPAATREPFGRWLLAQKSWGDWIDELAAAARLDPAFPKNGTPDEVGARMQKQGADGDAFEQLEDAARCWRSLRPSDC